MYRLHSYTEEEHLNLCIINLYILKITYILNSERQFAKYREYTMEKKQPV